MPLYAPGLLYLFVLKLNVPVNNFSVVSGRSQRFLCVTSNCRELMCLAQGHNTVTHVGIEPSTSRFGTRCSTTTPPRSLSLTIIEPPRGKTNNLHRRKQRRRSASRFFAKLISAFVFATRIVQFLFYLNPKFQDSSSFRCLYRSICVGPVRKPHCWFSHEVAQL